MVEKPNILIAVPCYRNTLHFETSNLLTSLALRLQRDGAKFTIRYFGSSDLTQTRNFYASLAVEAGFSHLLFIDNDMGAMADAVIRMISVNQPFVSMACPYRSIDFDRLRTTPTDVPVLKALSLSSTWAFSPATLTVKNGLAEVDRVGMALALIQRRALESLIKSGSLRQQRRHKFGNIGLSGPLFGFFDEIEEPEYESEDFSFCHRWRANGGTIHMLVDETVSHSGDYKFQAKLSDCLS